MDYIPQYIDGKWKPETVHYPDPCLEDLLKETYGVMVYQEQVMQVSQKIAGFSLGGADMLRRAMGKKKPEVLMGKKKEFIEGAIAQGFTEQHAADIFEIMIPFAGYGFNKSHAAAYTVLAYRTGYLKCHYPAEFMAANLTNELTSTDGVPQYLSECKRMGLKVLPPDINKSYSEFDVDNGDVIFAFRGMKGMGKEAADAIVREREEHGLYKSFMDFLERCLPLTIKDEEGREKRPLNSKAIEVCIKTGAFDKLGQNRTTLANNMERAIRYVNDKMNGTDNGQGDLFGDTDEKVYADFVFEELPDLPQMEKLNIEKEIIGSYVSGHPLDEYGKVISTCVTLSSKNMDRAAKEDKAFKESLAASGANSWANRNSGKMYTVLGFLQNLRQIHTKTGKDMAFAKLQDYDGEIDLTFFSKTWESLSSKLQSGNVYAFKGRVDGTREQPSFIVDSLEDVASLKTKSISEIHIELEKNITSPELEFSKIREILFAQTGSCSVYFHLDTVQGSYIVQANPQLTVSSSDETIKVLKEMNIIKDVWTA